MTHRADGEVKTLNDAEFEARVDELMKAEADDPMQFWFLSFASTPEAWRGCIVQAPGFTHAYVYAGIIGCRGRGEVMGVPIPPEEVPASEHHNKLLTKEEFALFWGSMKTEKQWDAEHGVTGAEEPDFKKSKDTDDGNIRWRNQGKHDDQKQ